MEIDEVRIRRRLRLYRRLAYHTVESIVQANAHLLQREIEIVSLPGVWEERAGVA